MITILSVLEDGYEQTLEHLAFRQLRGAYGCKLVCVPHNYPTLEEALSSQSGIMIFMVPPGRVSHSKEFSSYRLPLGDVTFVFGSPQETLVRYVKDDIALHITTRNDVDMMGVCVAAMVLYDHG